MGEEVFDSKTFSIALLAAQLLLLVLFATSRWIRPSRTGLWELTRTAFKPLPIHTQRAISARVNPKFVLTTVITSNAIGMLCARSLHYQFYAWLAWGSPFLLWRTGFHPVIQYVLWVAQEWAWNVYPSAYRVSKHYKVQVRRLTCERHGYELKGRCRRAGCHGGRRMDKHEK